MVANALCTHSKGSGFQPYDYGLRASGASSIATSSANRAAPSYSRYNLGGGDEIIDLCPFPVHGTFPGRTRTTRSDLGDAFRYPFLNNFVMLKYWVWRAQEGESSGFWSYIFSTAYLTDVAWQASYNARGFFVAAKETPGVVWNGLTGIPELAGAIWDIGSIAIENPGAVGHGFTDLGRSVLQGAELAFMDPQSAGEITGGVMFAVAAFGAVSQPQIRFQGQFHPAHKGLGPHMHYGPLYPGSTHPKLHFGPRNPSFGSGNFSIGEWIKGGMPWRWW